MILRLSRKLNAKIKVGELATLTAHVNPYTDFSAHLFVASRIQYILLTNTKSLYWIVMPGKGITNDSHFIDRAFSGLRAFIQADGQAAIYDRLIAPATHTVRFAKALDRRVTGSMNDLISYARILLTEGDMSPFDVEFRLNEMPLSMLKYDHPRKAFKAI